MTDKITLANLASLQNENTALSTINANNATLITAVDNTLSRDGTSPNSMGAALDMNSNQIINLPAPSTANSPARLADIQSIQAGGTIASIPTGGTTGQALVKTSNTDYATGWANSVTSVGLSLPADFTVTNSPVTTTGSLTGVWATTPTGSGAVVRATSPTLVTPALGVATATSVNKVALTAPATGSTLTIADGKTAVINNTLTFNGTDSTTQTFQATDTIVGRATTDTLTNKSISGSTNTLSAVPLSALATQAANTIVANATAGSAAPTAVDISTLTTKASPAAGDFVMISDQSASGALKKATVTSIGSAGSVSSVNGATGAIVSHHKPQGRLTLVTATPVMATSQSAKTTIFYTPYEGDMVPIYDGTNMVPTVFTELSQTTTDATKSPAAVAVSSVYDLFVWNDAGTIRCTRGPAWSSDTSRGYNLVMVNGILLNNSLITNGPAASRGTYVGTVRSNGSSQIDFIYGSAGTPGFFGVWNMYNRKQLFSTCTENTGSWTYTTLTYRTPNGGSSSRHTFVSGLAEDCIRATFNTWVQTVNSTGAFMTIGIAMDSSTSPDKASQFDNPGTGIAQTNLTAMQAYVPQLGVHYIQALERGDGVFANTFQGQSSAALVFEFMV